MQIDYQKIRVKIFLLQTYKLARANLKSRYRKTFAGFLWVVLNPLITFAVQAQIFTRVIKINIPNFYVFLLSGLLPWFFMSQSLEMGAPVLVSSGHLIKSFPVNPLVYVVAQIVDNFLNFIMSFAILLVVVSVIGHLSISTLVLLPISLGLLFLATISAACFFSVIQVFFRDTRYLLTFVLQVAFFTTPIFYAVENYPVGYRWIPEYNPMYIMIAPFRACLYSGDIGQFLARTFDSLVLTLLMMTLAMWLWRRKSNEIYSLL